MPVVKIPGVSVGALRPIREWDNRKQVMCDVDEQYELLRQLGKSKPKMELRRTNLSPAAAYHRNYVEYLSRCWADHIGAVVTPDIIWYTLLCEIATQVAAAPNDFRALFSTSDEKQDVVVQTDDPVDIPLDVLVAALSHKVPMQTNLWFPAFTTASDASRHACQAAFCDMVSPYYNYFTYCCDIPHFDVRGDIYDWQLLRQRFTAIAELPQFDQLAAWSTSVTNLLDNIITELDNPEWWSMMFRLEKCGSGSDVLLAGWITRLFVVQPELAKPQNFTTGISAVDYTFLPTNQKYRMQDGLFTSTVENDILVPSFGHVIHELVGDTKDPQ